MKTMLRSKIQGYEAFSKPRKRADGGGLLSLVKSDLSPVEVSNCDGDTELLIVEILVGKIKIRIINAYGPQEYDSNGKVAEFWEELEKEVIKAKNENYCVLIGMDANAKVGHTVIQNDPNPTSSNGKLLLGMIHRQNLVVLNSDPRCEGTITRYRKTVSGEEASVIDYILVDEQLSLHFESMFIDEDRTFVVSKVANKKGGRVKKVADHNMLMATSKLKYQKAKREPRIEVYDFKNVESQAKFYRITNETNILSDCFKGPLPPEVKSSKFFKSLDNLFHSSFKKIRIRKKGTFDSRLSSSHDLLFAEKVKLLNQLKCVINEDEKTTVKKKLEHIEFEIYKEVANRNAKIVVDQLNNLDLLDGSFNSTGMWKIKSKLFPRIKDPPTAKKDTFGNLVTAPLSLKELYLKTYKGRLEHRKIKEQYEEIRVLKEELWDLRYLKLKAQPSEPWSVQDLLNVVKQLKNNQCRDPNGMISEIFKEGVAGSDLLWAVLELMNMILETFHVPFDMIKADITSIWKKKGSRLDLSNDRGIFILSILRKILDKLLFMKLYCIEKGMSDSNIGARRKKNVRNHLFIVY